MDEEKKLEELKAENINRHIEKTMLEIEISDIIWKMHEKTYNVTIAIITLQLLLCILIAVISTLFGGIKTDFHRLSVSNLINAAIPFINIGLMLIVVINNKINTKAWHEARDKYNELFDIMDKIFDENYSIEDQTKLIEKVHNYKNKKVEKCKHKKQDIETQKVRSMK